MALKKVRWAKSLEMLFISQRCIVAQKVGSGIKTGAPTRKYFNARFPILTSIIIFISC